MSDLVPPGMTIRELQAKYRDPVFLNAPDEVRQRAFVWSATYPAGTIPWHTHRRAQLSHVSKGVLTVRTEEGLWVVPPQRAVWVLPGVKHSQYSSRPYRACALHVDPALVALPPRCSVVAIEPVVQQLLLEAARFGDRYEPDSAEDHLLQVVLERLPTLPVAALHLPEPKDKRLRLITEGIQEDPSDKRPLTAWARAAGLTLRTAARLFHRELNMTFGAWRQQLRLLVALERLGFGESVTNVALEVGYGDVSAFIAMFKAALGTTPARYFRQTSDR